MRAYHPLLVGNMLADEALEDDGAEDIEMPSLKPHGLLSPSSSFSQNSPGLISPNSFKSLTDLQAHVIAERTAKSGLFGDGTVGAKSGGCRGLAQKVAGSVWFERVVLVLICMNSIAIAVECKEGAHLFPPHPPPAFTPDSRA